MKKPILFNTEMVRAILEGRKTVTRRVIKPQPIFKTHRYYVFEDETCPKKWEQCDDFVGECAPYQIGDILYVRESAMITSYGGGDSGYYIDCCFCDGENKRFTVPFEEYKRVMNKCVKIWNEKDPYKHPKFSSYWLTKHEARIWLKVTDVRVERLQDITPKQAGQEGVQWETDNSGLYRKFQFHKLWDSTIKKQDLNKYGWNANPWVWVIEFERSVKDAGSN